MKYQQPLVRGTLIRRYKRFLADVIFPGGEEVTVHCPNTGSMRNCIVDDSECWLSRSDNPKRKYPYTWELATTPSGALASVNTQKANALVLEGIENGVISELQGYDEVFTERPYGQEKSRIDVLLKKPGQDCYVEVKECHLGS